MNFFVFIFLVNFPFGFPDETRCKKQDESFGILWRNWNVTEYVCVNSVSNSFSIYLFLW